MHLIVKKLQFKAHSPVLVRCAPAAFAEPLRSLADLTEVDQAPLADKTYAFALFFCEQQKDIAEAAQQIEGHLTPDTLLWVAYPKKSSKRYRSDITRDQG